jgi:hypothetical protein
VAHTTPPESSRKAAVEAKPCSVLDNGNEREKTDGSTKQAERSGRTRSHLVSRTRTISKTNQNPPAAPLPLRDETPPAVPVEEPVCTPPWANTMFGSVICAPGPAAPPLRPLWHEATDAISASGISRAAIPISFRIAHNWRAFAGCKLVFDEAVQAMIGKPVTLGERVAPASA